MIESTLEFPSTALRSLVATLCTLPDELRPTHHSLGEDKKGKPILDIDKFIKSLDGKKLGPFLKGPHVMYDIRLSGGKPIICNCLLEVEPSLAKKFLVLMSAAQPIFGFACEPEERKYRNQVTVKQGVNTIESWVGRDPQKYIPGFYWLTLLPEALAERHGVALSVVGRAAKEHIELEGGQHLFRFYDRPEDWRFISHVTALCSSLLGVFDIEKVNDLLAVAKTFRELDDVLRGWR